MGSYHTYRRSPAGWPTVHLHRLHSWSILVLRLRPTLTLACLPVLLPVRYRFFLAVFGHHLRRSLLNQGLATSPLQQLQEEDHLTALPPHTPLVPHLLSLCALLHSGHSWLLCWGRDAALGRKEATAPRFGQQSAALQNYFPYLHREDQASQAPAPLEERV